MDNADIIKRFESLESERRGTVEGVWDEIEKFVLPLRGDFYSTLNSEGEVDWRRREIYDSTAVLACQSLAASIQGNLTSPSQKWFDLRFRDDELNDNDAAMEWLEDCSERIYQALNESNFDIEIAEAYLDLVGFGTSSITEEVDEDGKLLFSAVPVREAFFEEDHKKQVYRFYRRLQWTATQIISKFGEENVPDKIRKMADTPDGSTQTQVVIFCIYPRDVPADLDVSKPIADKSRPFGYKYVLKTGQETLGEEGGYYEMPSFVSRWRKTAGSRWGHSPATVALADILMLNQIKEATVEAAGKAIDPASLVLESALLSDLDLERGGKTIVNDIDGVRPYESGTKFDVANMEISMLVDSIRNAFFQNQLELKESPAMTATEVNVRYELMQRLLGPTLGRLKTDLLDPLIQRSFNILYRAGQLEEMPQELTAAPLDIEYNGPLPRAQQSDTAMAIEQWLMGLAQMAEVFPEAMDLVDTDEAVRTIATLRGVPAKVLKSAQEIEEKRSQRNQQMQVAQTIQAAQGAGDAMQAVGQGAQALTAVPEGEAAA